MKLNLSHLAHDAGQTVEDALLWNKEKLQYCINIILASVVENYSEICLFRDDYFN